jgi:hypothetical protein
MPLSDLASRAHASGVTVTEMLLAAVAGALGERLAAADGRREGAVHALVPVSVRAGVSAAAGNRFTSVLVPLPIAVLDPSQRLRLAADGLRAARSRTIVGAGVRLVGAAGLVGGAIERLGVSLFSHKASVVVSSVRGPGEPLHLGGSLLRDIIVWAPPPGAIALAVTLMSYAGGVRVGVSADARAIGDPGPIARAIERDLGVPRNRA